MPTLKKKMLKCYEQRKHRPILHAYVDVVSDEVEIEAEEEYDEMNADDNEMAFAEI